MPRGGPREGAGRKKIYEDEKARNKAKNERAKERRKLKLEQVRAVDKMRDLSVEIIKGIFLFMDIDQIYDCSLVCKNWHTVSKDQELWRTLCFRRWKFLQVVNPKHFGDLDWKHIAKSCWKNELGSIREIKSLIDELIEDPENMQIEEKFVSQLEHYRCWRKMRLPDPVATVRKHCCDLPSTCEPFIDFLFKTAVYKNFDQKKSNDEDLICIDQAVNGTMLSLAGPPLYFSVERTISTPPRPEDSNSLSLAFSYTKDMEDWKELLVQGPDVGTLSQLLSELRIKFGLQETPVQTHHLLLILALIWCGEKDCEVIMSRYNFDHVLVNG